uniref:ATP synthase complex subunit 8 n=1 Tax=Fejervarya limnocharis TaxID=110108 RepID=Q7YA19_FEJLI|nr:ATP synthase F0 subunit 8 [Fejervarya limnocharis]AAO12111.1 ATPase 8 [Fejervarya limnocharis]WCI19170.1 ATP synthase F0 subunit 8 [Fejervarya limnocharis]WCI19183.1 ATP synthase F0 subunit 8 [Fejervarya limnocharis]
MPQLLPEPWFYIFFFSWTIFLIATPIKIASYEFFKDPLPGALKTNSMTWSWKW